MRHKFNLSARLLLLIALGIAQLYFAQHDNTSKSAIQSSVLKLADATTNINEDERRTLESNTSLTEWLERWREDRYEGSKSEFLSQGILLANKHREKIERLVESDPDSALAESVSYLEYAQLPEPIQKLIEEPFSEVSDISVVIGCNESGSQTFYSLEEQSGKSSTLYMPAKHRVTSSKRKLPLQGIRMNGKAVPRGNVFQIVDGDEANWLTRNWPPGQQDEKSCYRSGEPIMGDPTIAISGGRVFHFQDKDSVNSLEAILREADAKPGLDNGSAWIMRTVLSEGFPLEEFQTQVASSALQATTGAKTVLVILADFPDYPNGSFDAATVEGILDEEVDSALRAYSYNKMSLDGIVTGYTIRAQNNSSYYEDNYDALHDEIVANYLARGNANPFSEYDSVCVAIEGTQLSLVGLAAVGGQKVWVEISGNGDGHVFAHELGHNYGLHHANYWDYSTSNPSSTNPVDPTGSDEEYGDMFDTMGSSDRSYILDNHFHMAAKEYLGWINNTQWEDLNSASDNGTYRIYRFDDIDASNLQALRIYKSATNDHYWLGYRYEHKNLEALRNSAYLLWERASGRPHLSQSWLIDTTPGSELGKIDAGIAVGRTYSDSASNIHITPTEKGGLSPNEYIDIVVNFGPFPGNVAPSGSISGPSSADARTQLIFSANVSDPNGDALAYHWDVGDGSFQENSASISHSWTKGGNYTIKLTLSDMKGGRTTLTQNVTVSDPLDTWFERTSGISSDILGVAANQTHVVAVGVYTKILRSVDGANWVDVSPPDTYNTNFQDIIWTGSEFYAVGGAYDSAINGWRGVIYKSTTGQTWALDYIVPTAQTELIADRNSELLSIAVDDNSTLVVVGRAATVLRNSAAGAWAPINTSVTSTHVIADIAYGDNYFIFVGHATTPSYHGDVAVFRSTDGLIWQDVSSGAAIDSWQDFREIEFSDGVFLASGHYSRACVSTDNGQTWSTAQTGNRHTLAGFASIGNLQYAVGLDYDDSSIDIDLISTDGINWTPTNPGNIEDRREMLAFNNSFISVGNNGSIRQSAPLNPDNIAPNGNIEGPNTIDARQLTLLNADALDPNGDDLAYIWDMGDGTFEENSPSITHSWLRGGNYVVKLTVSDMQGGYATITQNVTVSDPLDTWSERASGISGDILGVAANQTHVVAVGVSAKILRSVDGANWVDVSPPATYNTNFQDVIWTGSEFYAVGVFYDLDVNGWGGVVYKSTTGQTWMLDYKIPSALTESIVDRNSELLGIAFDGNSTLVAVGRGATVLCKSANDAWVPISTTVTSTHVLEDVAFGDGYFIFVGHKTTPSYHGDVAVFRSTDGLIWQDVSSGAAIDSWQDFREIEFSDGVFLASGHYSRACVSTDNGQTWSTAQTGNRHTLAGFASIGNLQYAVGLDYDDSSIDIDLISTDGINWTPTNPGNIEDRREMLAFNNSFISVGNNGSIRQSAPLNPDNIAPNGNIEGPNTIDARQLTLLNADALDPNGDDLAYIWDMGDGTFEENSPSITHSWLRGGNYVVKLTVSDMQGGYATITQNVTVSDPLDTWSERASGISGDILGVAANQTHVVAVGVSAKILRSVDGANWVDVSPPATYNTNFQDVIWTGSEFYAVGVFYDLDVNGWGGVVYKSTTGQTWMLDYKIPSALTESIVDRNSELLGIAFDGNSTLVAVGRGATVLCKSANDAWVPISTTVTSTHVLEDVAFGDGYFIFVGHKTTSGYNGDVAVFRSTDGINWSDTSSGSGLESWQDYREIEFLGDSFYASGFYGRARRSTDQGLTWQTSQTGNRHTLDGFTSVNGIHYAVGVNHDNSSADIDLISADGINWIPVNPGDLDNRREAIAFNDTIITVGNNGSIRQSAPVANSQDYQTFSKDYFEEGGIDAEGSSNPDFDWANNLIEYALGGNPSSSTDAPDRPIMYFDEFNYAVFQIVRDAKQQDVAYSVWWTQDLKTWTRAGLTIIEDSSTSLKVRTNQTFTEKDKAFFRLQLDR